MLKLAHRGIQSRMKDPLSKKDQYDKKKCIFLFNRMMFSVQCASMSNIC